MLLPRLHVISLCRLRVHYIHTHHSDEIECYSQHEVMQNLWSSGTSQSIGSNHGSAWSDWEPVKLWHQSACWFWSWHCISKKIQPGVYLQYQEWCGPNLSRNNLLYILLDLLYVCCIFPWMILAPFRSIPVSHGRPCCFLGSAQFTQSQCLALYKLCLWH